MGKTDKDESEKCMTILKDVVWNFVSCVLLCFGVF